MLRAAEGEFVPDERSPLAGLPRVYVEPWPAGGWVVRLDEHPVPVSRHDTEEEAESRAAAYRRGLERGPRAAFGRSDAQAGPPRSHAVEPRHGGESEPA